MRTVKYITVSDTSEAALQTRMLPAEYDTTVFTGRRPSGRPANQPAAPPTPSPKNQNPGREAVNPNPSHYVSNICQHHPDRRTAAVSQYASSNQNIQRNLKGNQHRAYSHCETVKPAAIRPI